MTGQPRVFISYARSDGEAFAGALRAKFQAEEPGITLWQDRTRMEGGKDWWKQITEALDQVQFMVLVMTPAALKSPIVRKEWQYARQRGVCVYPVIGASNLDFKAMPSWMSKAHFYDLDKEWETFVNYLKSPCQVSRLPFMAPDPTENFVERTAVFTHLLDAVLDTPRENPIPGMVVLYGAGGFGKTTLAIALCHSDGVITTFDAGILWVTLGEKPNMQAELTKLYIALTDDRRGFVDEQDASLHLAERLGDHTYLLVIDDVWNEAHLQPFLRGGANCTRLITTRKFDIAANLERRIEVDVMQPAEAVRLLTIRIDPPPRDLIPFYAMAKRLGEWPLLLELAGGALHQRLVRGDTIDGALNHLKQALDRWGAVAFDRYDVTARNQAIERSLGVSLDLLANEERQRYTELAIFPRDIALPLAVISALWNMDEFDTEALVQRLSDLALLKYSLPTATIRLHDMVQVYLADQLTDTALFHTRLLNAWGDPHQLPNIYAWRWIGYHLIAAERQATLRQLLLDYTWLEAKLKATTPNLLVVDCARLLDDPIIQELGRTLRQAAHVLVEDSSQLAGQLLGRLLDTDAPELKALLAQAIQTQSSPWLRPLTASLREPAALVRTLAGHTDGVNALAITPDGHYVLSASYDHTLRVWDILSGQLLYTLSHTAKVYGVAVTPDGRYAISAAGDNTLKHWDLTSGQLLATLTGHSRAVRGVAVTPDGRYAISASEDTTLKIWDILNRQETHTLVGHADWVRGVVVTSDGRTIVSASGDKTLKLWDLTNGQLLDTLTGHTGAIRGITVTPDGRYAISSSEDTTLKLWDLVKRQLIHTLVGHTDWVRGVAITPDGRYIISASGDKTLIVWDLISRQEIHTLVGHTHRVRAVAVTPTGRYVVSASDDTTIKMWDIATSQPLYMLTSHTGTINGIAVTPDGRYAISASSDKTLKLWEMTNGQLLRTLTGHTDWIRAVAVTPDGRYAISAADDKTVKLWEIASGALVHTLTGHTDTVRALAVTPDGRALVAASKDKTLTLWDVATGQLLHTLAGHTDWINGVAITPDGRHIVSASGDKTLKVWDITNGQPLQTFTGHTDWINGVAITPDGLHTISISSDKTLKVWDMTSGQLLHTLVGHADAINGVAVTTNGQHILSVSKDMTLKIWTLKEGQQITTWRAWEPLWACAVAPNSLEIVVGGRSGRVHFLRLAGV